MQEYNHNNFMISAPSEWDHTSLNREVQLYRNINWTRISEVRESSLDRGPLWFSPD